MKKTRKLISLLMALAMIFALAIPAFAASDYTITIKSAAGGETYSAYKVFDVDSYTEDGKVSYTIERNSTFYSVVANSDIFTLTQVGTSDTYVVTLKDSNTTAEKILEVLKEANLDDVVANGTVTPTDDGDAVIDLTEAGYYYVTTTLGSVVALDSTTPNATLENKWAEPTPAKTVSNAENTTGSASNSASIGDTVYYTVKINDAANVINLKVTDTLSAGLTLNKNVVVKIGDNVVDESNYTVTYGEYSSETGTTLTIEFEDDYLETLSSSDVITITYSAVVNANAVIDENDKGNTNEVKLSYGNDSESTSDKTTTNVYSFSLNKTTSDGTSLSGAEFTLSDSNGTINFVKVDDDYRVATDSDENATDTIVAGSVKISGLGAGEYTLTETKAPTGYNKLTYSITVTISENGDVTFKNASTESKIEADANNSDQVNVVNQAGTELPSTGGMGTTLFYIFGGALVLCAVVLLVTRRRMDNEQ